MSTAKERARTFCRRLGLRMPILLAPMAGACPASLSIAVARAGGLGACGALLMQPDAIAAWVAELRAGTDGPFQLNLWVPDPPPRRDAAHEHALREFLAQWGPPVPGQAGDAEPPDFGAQCEALLAARPPAVSSIMGLFPPMFVARLKAAGILWLANATTVGEARAAEAAGADVIVAQGMEAGGHRGCFDAALAEPQQVGLFALLPAIVDAVGVPVVATGGIADDRGVAAAFALGASAVQIGTGFLRTPEAQLPPAWADALVRTAPEDTVLSRAFSGRAGRSIATRYVRAAASNAAPAPAPYPVQRGLTAGMRAQAITRGDVDCMQAWAGQAARLAPA
ncbi:MAG TPA: nitronate monooxygenase, partial [Burkholderiaceae bacterium]